MRRGRCWRQLAVVGVGVMRREGRGHYQHPHGCITCFEHQGHPTEEDKGNEGTLVLKGAALSHQRPEMLCGVLGRELHELHRNEEMVASTACHAVSPNHGSSHAHRLHNSLT